MAGFLRQRKVSDLQALNAGKNMLQCLAAIVREKKQERIPLKYHFAKKLISLDPRQMKKGLRDAVKMFKLVFANLLMQNGEQQHRPDDILGQYRKFISEAKQFHHEKFAGFRFGEDRLDSFLFEVLHVEQAYKDMWNTLKILLTFAHGQLP